jgi:hypothetical protein
MARPPVTTGTKVEGNAQRRKLIPVKVKKSPPSAGAAAQQPEQKGGIVKAGQTDPNEQVKAKYAKGEYSPKPRWDCELI